MTDHSTTVHRAVVGPDGALYAAVVCHDGESFSSFVYCESDVSSDANVTKVLTQKPFAFYDLWRAPSGALFVCDEEGNVHTSANGKTWKKQSVASGALTRIWGLDDGVVFAAGVEGIVYHFDGKAWKRSSDPLGGAIGALHGSDAKNVYAAGDSGLLARFDGKTWTPVSLATKSRLNGIFVVGDDDVVVCGDQGLLLRGQKTLAKTKHTLFDVVLHGGELYVAAGSKGVFKVKKDKLAPVKDTFAVYRLASAHGYLTTAGGGDAVRFDGESWDGPTYES